MYELIFRKDCQNVTTFATEKKLSQGESDHILLLSQLLHSVPTNELMVITSVLILDTSKTFFFWLKKKKKIKTLIVMSSLFTFILHDFSAKSGSIIVTFGRGLSLLLSVH